MIKRTIVVIMATLVLAGAIAPAIATASSWNVSQSRMRKDAIKQQKAEKAFWKQVEAELSKLQAETHEDDKSAPKSK